jgi:hypothetical protein
MFAILKKPLGIQPSVLRIVSHCATDRLSPPERVDANQSSEINVGTVAETAAVDAWFLATAAQGAEFAAQAASPGLPEVGRDPPRAAAALATAGSSSNRRWSQALGLLCRPLDASLKHN